MAAVPTVWPMTDRQLVAAAVEPARGDGDAAGAALLHRAIDRRDEAAWNVLVSLHYPAVFRQAMRACGDRSLAEDIAQDTFLKVFRSGRSFRGDRPLAHWIARIATTTAIDALRRNRTVHRELDDSHTAPDDPERTCIDNEQQQRVREAVQGLPAHLREIVMLTTFAELSYEAAAQELGIPLRTAMSRAVAARARLRRLLTRLGDER